MHYYCSIIEASRRQQQPIRQHRPSFDSHSPSSPNNSNIASTTSPARPFAAATAHRHRHRRPPAPARHHQPYCIHSIVARHARTAITASTSTRPTSITFIHIARHHHHRHSSRWPFTAHHLSSPTASHHRPPSPRAHSSARHRSSRAGRASSPSSSVVVVVAAAIAGYAIGIVRHHTLHRHSATPSPSRSNHRRRPFIASFVVVHCHHHHLSSRPPSTSHRQTPSPAPPSIVDARRALPCTDASTPSARAQHRHRAQSPAIADAMPIGRPPFAIVHSHHHYRHRPRPIAQSSPHSLPIHSITHRQRHRQHHRQRQQHRQQPFDTSATHCQQPITPSNSRHHRHRAIARHLPAIIIIAITIIRPITSAPPPFGALHRAAHARRQQRHCRRQPAHGTQHQSSYARPPSIAHIANRHRPPPPIAHIANRHHHNAIIANIRHHRRPSATLHRAHPSRRRHIARHPPIVNNTLHSLPIAQRHHYKHRRRHYARHHACQHYHALSHCHCIAINIARRRRIASSAPSPRQHRPDARSAHHSPPTGCTQHRHHHHCHRQHSFIATCRHCHRLRPTPAIVRSFGPPSLPTPPAPIIIVVVVIVRIGANIGNIAFTTHRRSLPPAPPIAPTLTATRHSSRLIAANASIIDIAIAAPARPPAPVRPPARPPAQQVPAQRAAGTAGIDSTSTTHCQHSPSFDHRRPYHCRQQSSPIARQPANDKSNDDDTVQMMSSSVVDDDMNDDDDEDGWLMEWLEVNLR